VVHLVGLDIGGANTKAAFVGTAGGEVKGLRTATKYFPFWKRDTKQLCHMLLTLKLEVAGDAKLDCIGVTMTAELSDAYRTKREGVNHILDCVANVFADTPILVATVDATLESVEAARANPLEVAAANWAATGWMVSRLVSNCVIVDVGSTSTSIIPIRGGKVAAEGKTDLEKLISGELVYTGSLRTNVAAIVNSVPAIGGWARVSSELFAQSADIHLILRSISMEDYTVETPDGKGKTPDDALARLARIVCADTEMLAEKEIIRIAEHVYERQLKQIADALNQVYSRLNPNAKATVPVVVTGLGRNFLAKKAAAKAAINEIVDIGELLPEGTALASPAVAVALMTATKLEGRSLKWTL
jgi:probable H4MPT-linked C1 transfer pathway protein